MSEEEPKTVKAVLLGEAGVGKTCLISRFVNNIFENNTMTSVSASYATKTMVFKDLGGKSIKFEIWDTAGQERYRSISKLLYKDAEITILVYDITQRRTYDEIKDYWYKEIKENSQGNIILGVAGNKCDLYEDEKVSEEEARDFADEIGAIFQLTSSLENRGITELFKKIGYKILSPEITKSKKDDQKDEVVEEKSIKLNDVKVKKKKKCC